MGEGSCDVGDSEEVKTLPTPTQRAHAITDINSSTPDDASSRGTRDAAPVSASLRLHFD